MTNRTTLFFLLALRTESLCSKRLRDFKFLRIKRPRHLSVKKRKINSEKSKNSIYMVALSVQNANEPSWYYFHILISFRKITSPVLKVALSRPYSMKLIRVASL